ncbi:MAG TPA: DinB family protein [Mycobacteriales bacterium]|nr:DinB family protein [Mycobacteriales bacterium]
MEITEPPVAGDETAAVLGELDRLRSYIEWKCGGLDSAGLSASLGPSTMTLGGLLKHLALVEDSHFSRMLFNREPGPPWDAVDWDTSPDWEWESAAQDSPEQLMALWKQAVERSRGVVAEAFAAGGFDHIGQYVARSGQSPNLRRMLLDLIEEYARHLGHADLIRESVDGLVGEDPTRE